MAIKSNKRVKFTTVNNEMLNDPNLSLQDKGLLTILLSDPNEVSVKKLVKRSKNGECAHYNSIDNLIKNGYLARVKLLNEETKRFKKTIYIFSDSKEDVVAELEQYKNNEFAVIQKGGF